MTHICVSLLQADDNNEIIQLRATGPEFGAWAYFHNSNPIRPIINDTIAASWPSLEEQFRQAIVNYHYLKRTAVGEVCKIFSEIDAIAEECKNQNLDDAIFVQRIQGRVDRFAQIFKLCRYFRRKSAEASRFLDDVHAVITNLVPDPLHSFEVPLDLTDGLSERFDRLSWNDGVAVGKGMAAEGKSSLGLHQLFPPVNGWYLQIRVTQHRDEDDDDGEEVQPQYVEDRLTYPVEDEIIKVRIRNIAVASYSIEDDLESSLDEELVIKVFESADKGNEVGRAILNHEIKAVTRTIKPGMICELEDKDTHNCVLRIDVVDA